MSTIRRALSRFQNLRRTGGLGSAVRRLFLKPRAVLIRPALRETARVAGDLERAGHAITTLQDRVSALEANPFEPHVKDVDARVSAVHQEVEAVLADLAVERARLNELQDLLGTHARSIAALGELQGESAAVAGAAPADGPLISVVMPTHNRAGDLRRAVASVQAQTWPRWELIVVDDGSADGTRDVLADLSSTDPRIRVVAQAHQGHAAARNTGLAQARGDVIAYLDDDNEYYPEYLSAVARAFTADPATEMTYAAQVWLGQGTADRVTFDRFDWAALRDMRTSLDTNVLAHRRSFGQRLGGFDPDLLRHADLDLVLRYGAATRPVRIPVMGARYRWDAHPTVSSTMSSAAAIHRIREKHVTPEGTGLRVLLLAHDYPQLSESYIHVEIRWMLTRGVAMEVFSRERPVSEGEALVDVHYDDLEAVVRRFRPHVIHVHWLVQAQDRGPMLARFGVPVTVKGHGFDHSVALAEDVLAQPWLHRLYLFGNLPQAGPAFAAKVRECRAAVDTSRYYPVHRKDRRLVVRAGACLPTKDLELFVEVAARCPEYRFVLALSTNRHGDDTEARVRARNAELGHPVEILADVQYGPMGELMRLAGVYLHTFGFVQPFAQPISIAEAMACGTVPLVRRAEATRAYTGDAALYYDTVDDAVSVLQRMLTWDDATWQRAQRAAVDRAYLDHADTVVLDPMLRDWLAVRDGAGVLRV